MRWLVPGLILLALVVWGAPQPDGWPELRSAPDRARVLVVQAPGTTFQFAPQPVAVSNLVARGLMELTGRATPQEAWHSLVSTQDTLGLKVFSRPGAISGTRPPVVEAVVASLLEAGWRPEQLVLWDRHLSDLRLAGFFEIAQRYGIRVAGSAESGFTPDLYYETPLIGQLIWGDLEFGQSGLTVGRKSFAARLVASDMSRIISIVPLLNNNEAAISGHNWGLALASVDNTLRFESTRGRLAEAVPEILALEGLDLAERLVLAITDAMLCQYQGEERQLLHYSAVLDQLWFSVDPVALDVLGVLEIERQRQAHGLSSRKPDLTLLENCSLLELGISNTNRIDVTQVRFPAVPRPAPDALPPLPNLPTPAAAQRRSRSSRRPIWSSPRGDHRVAFLAAAQEQVLAEEQVRATEGTLRAGLPDVVHIDAATADGLAGLAL